jgi:hypothetical protein
MGKKKSIIASVAGQKAADFAINRAVDEQGNPTPAFQKVVLKALDVQRPLVLRNLNRLRRQNPQDTPAQLAERLGKQYLAAITGGGAAVGGTAVVPGIGTATALGLSAAATVGFLEATALYAQSVAELMGIPTDDPKRAQTLVMAVMLGEDGRRMLRDFTSQANGRGMGPLAGPLSMVSGSAGVSEVLFNQMKRMFIKRFIVRQGAGMLGRVVPFGVGAVVGGLANRVMGKGVVRAAQNLFGPLPATIPGALASELKALPTGRKGRKDGGDDAGPESDAEAFGELMAEDIETDFQQLTDDGTLEDLRREDPEAFAAEVEAAREAHRRARGER